MTTKAATKAPAEPEKEEPSAPPLSDLDRFIPELGVVQLVGDDSPLLDAIPGLKVNLLPLKTRQFFRLIKVVTKGAPELIGGMMELGEQNTAEDYATNLAAMVLFSVGNAEDEAINFLKGMVEYPSDVKVASQLDIYLDNPELDDMISIIEGTLRAEASDLMALGKRLQQMMTLAEKTGQVKKPTKATRQRQAS